MARSLIAFYSTSKWPQSAATFSVGAGENIDFTVRALPAGASAVLRISETAGGDPIAELGAGVSALPDSLTEGSIYYYNAWAGEPGDMIVVGRGAFRVEPSIVSATGTISIITATTNITATTQIGA